MGLLTFLPIAFVIWHQVWLFQYMSCLYFVIIFQLPLISYQYAGRGRGEVIIFPNVETMTRPLESSVLLACSANGLGSPDIDPHLRWFDPDDVEITSTTGR